MKHPVRNAVALDLATRKYALRIVAKAKGKGSYRRNKKHRTLNNGGASSVLGHESSGLYRIVARLGHIIFDADVWSAYCSRTEAKEASMRAHPTRIWDPPVIAAVAAFVFVAGMLIGSPAVMAASAGLLVMAVIGAGLVSVMRRFQVLPQPAGRGAHRR